MSVITRDDLRRMHKQGARRFFRQGNRRPKAWSWRDGDIEIRIHVHREEDGCSVDAVQNTYASPDGAYRSITEHHDEVATALDRIPVLCLALRNLGRAT